MTEQNETVDNAGDPDVEAAEKSLLSFRAPGRPLDPTREAIADELTKMLDVIGEKFTPTKLLTVCENTGTHLLKLISTKAETGHSTLRFPYRTSNRPPALRPSGGAADIPYQKFLFRPLEITGHDTRSLADHAASPDAISSVVLAAFEDVVGDELCLQIVDVMKRGPAPVAKLPIEEFPVIFVPSSNGGDLQITPISRAEVYSRMRDVRRPFIQKAPAKLSADAPRPRRGRWSELALTGKMVNVSGMLNGPRIRFHAVVPQVSADDTARLRAYAMGGGFPWIRDNALRDGVTALGEAITACSRGYTNAAMLRGLEQRATTILRSVHGQMCEIRAEAELVRADLDQIDGEEMPAIKLMPTPAEVLIRMFPRAEQDAAVKILTSNVFTAAQSLYLQEKS